MKQKNTIPEACKAKAKLKSWKIAHKMEDEVMHVENFALGLKHLIEHIHSEGNRDPRNGGILLELVYQLDDNAKALSEDFHELWDAIKTEHWTKLDAEQRGLN